MQQYFTSVDLNGTQYNIDFIGKIYMGCSSSQAKQTQNILQERINRMINPVLAQSGPSELKSKMKDITNYIINETKLYVTKKYKKYLEGLKEKTLSVLGDPKFSELNEVTWNHFEAITSKIIKLQQSLDKDYKNYENWVVGCRKKLSPKSRDILITQMDFQSKSEFEEKSQVKFQKQQRKCQIEIEAKSDYDFSKRANSFKFKNQYTTCSILQNPDYPKIEEEKTRKYSIEAGKSQEEFKLLQRKIQGLEDHNTQLNYKYQLLSKQILQLKSVNNKKSSEIYKQMSDSLSQNIRSYSNLHNVAQSIFIIDSYPLKEPRKNEFKSIEAQVQTEEIKELDLKKFVEISTLELLQQSRILPNLKNLKSFISTRLFLRNLFKEEIKSKPYYYSQQEQYCYNLQKKQKEENLLILMSLQSGQIIGGFIGMNNQERQNESILFIISQKSAFREKKGKQISSMKPNEYEQIQAIDKKVGQNCLAIDLQCSYLLKNYRVIFELFFGVDLGHNGIQKYQIHQIGF